MGHLRQPLRRACDPRRGLWLGDCRDRQRPQARRTGAGAVAGHRLEPTRLPVDEAARLAPSVGLPVATHVGQVDRVLHLAHAGPVDRVAGLAGDLVDSERPAAVPQHLRHELQGVVFAARIQPGEDLLGGPDLHEVTQREPVDRFRPISNHHRALLVGSRCRTRVRAGRSTPLPWPFILISGARHSLLPPEGETSNDAQASLYVTDRTVAPP